MTAPSYRAVHYAQRPAKNIERKMMVDVVSRLQRVVDLADSRYIGLGSVFFTDFSLVHRALGMTDMISIENTQDRAVRQRFDSNRPYDCVVLKFGHTNDELPALFGGPQADKHTVVWLDYDKPLADWMLTDLATVAQTAPPFSVLALSVSVEPGFADETRVADLKGRVGAAKVPRHVRVGADLSGERTAAVSHEIVRAEVNRTLKVRNAGRPASERLVAHQVFNFRYADDARMMTVGWLLVRASDERKARSLRLEELDYVKDAEEAFHIRVPRLTTRETLHFDRQLPTPASSFEVPPGVAQRDAEDYLRLYRFFPNFVDATL